MPLSSKKFSSIQNLILVQKFGARIDQALEAPKMYTLCISKPSVAVCPLAHPTNAVNTPKSQRKGTIKIYKISRIEKTDGIQMLAMGINTKRDLLCRKNLN